METKHKFLTKSLLIVVLVLCAFAQTALAGDWVKRYTKDAFGDEICPAYTVDLKGTTNVVRQNEGCTLGLMACKQPGVSFAVFRAFLVRGGELQNFWSDTQAYVKLANGKKFNIPCDPENGNLWLGRTPQECNAITDILNNGNFTLVIVSRNYDITMKCTFNVSSQTTGLKRLLNQ